tara:strand:+ start:2196 stop:2726 length:531 start_codon:yes stop_codon:yes gene_type:complete
MNNKILNFLSNKFEILQNLGIADKETSKEKYLDVSNKILQEQEEKNLVSDKKIKYNDKIIKIEYIGDMETVDISVTGDSLFYCNGVLTKNSIGLAATCDVICSLWQEEEDRELGIINMGMQKNRFGPNFGHGAFKCNYNTLTLKETNPDYFEEDKPSTESVVKGADNALNRLTNEE